MKPIAVLFATLFEAQSFVFNSKAVRHTDWHYENSKASIVITGVGKVNAAIKTSKAIQDGAKLIINAGITGSVFKEFRLFDVLMPNKIIDLDRLIGPFANEAIEIPSKDNVTIGTTDIPIHGGPSKLNAEKHCQLVDMESYAISATSKEFQVETKLIKCVSDFCEEGGEKNIKANLAKASMILSQILFSQGYA